MSKKDPDGWPKEHPFKHRCRLCGEEFVGVTSECDDCWPKERPVKHRCWLCREEFVGVTRLCDACRNKVRNQGAPKELKESERKK